MNSESFVTSFLDQSSYVIVNENMIRMLNGDCITAVLLARLITLYKYFLETKSLRDGYFFQKVEDIENKLGINAYHQRTSFVVLKEMGIIEIRMDGSPPMRFFKINFATLEKLLLREILPKKSVSTDQKDFYRKLNAIINYAEIQEVKGNIPMIIADFMFAFKVALRGSFSGWNPESYGILATYFKKKYIKPNRVFNYKTLSEWLEKEEPKTLKNFIQYNEEAYNDILQPRTVIEFLKEFE